MISSFRALSVFAAIAVTATATTYAQASNDHTVLILSESVSGGSSSLEAQAAIALGYDVQMATDAEWGAMSASDFATYRALVVGDPTCSYSLSPIDAAESNTSTWGPELDGNIVIIGTDPVFHSWGGGGPLALIQKSMAFVLSIPNSAGKTGAYLTLGCSYEGGSVGTVTLLDGVGNGGFEAEATSCHNDAHITAYHAALDGLTDADLSNWSCSIHSVFSAWDTENFEVLAIGEGLGNSYTDEDGSVGSPYILAKGVCNSTPTISVSLSPNTLWSPNNQMNNIAATVTTTGDAVTVELVSIVSDEGDEANDVANATTGTDDQAFQLRAQRDGSGDGRVYTVTYRATDECGHEVEASATVTVPHDSRP